MLQPYQERVIEEKAQLDERLEKLTAFFDTDEYANTWMGEQVRMVYQAKLMRKLSNVLHQRITYFKQTEEKS